MLEHHHQLDAGGIDVVGRGERAEAFRFENIARILESIAVAEKQHEKRYLGLSANVDAGTVFKKQTTVRWRCRNCGYVHEGTDAPAACAHPQAHFEVLGENW